MSAVLDWELSTLGDRLSDLAYHCMVYHIHHKSSIMQGLRGEFDYETVSSDHTTQILSTVGFQASVLI